MVSLLVVVLSLLVVWQLRQIFQLKVPTLGSETAERLTEASRQLPWTQAFGVACAPTDGAGLGALLPLCGWCDKSALQLSLVVTN